MGQWTRVENNNEVFLRVTNHTGQAEKNLLGPAGIRTRDLKHLIIILHPSSLSHNNNLKFLTCLTSSVCVPNRQRLTTNENAHISHVIV